MADANPTAVIAANLTVLGSAAERLEWVASRRERPRQTGCRDAGAQRRRVFCSVQGVTAMRPRPTASATSTDRALPRLSVAVGLAVGAVTVASIAAASIAEINKPATVDVAAERLDGADSDGSSGGPSLDPFVCRDYAASVAGQVSDPTITEISGMARGRRDESVLWVHEDSGAMADVHALTLSGTVRRTFRLAGAQAKDWEDMAVGPGPDAGTNYLYLGDIGDNAKARDDIVVYRVPEPAVSNGALTTLSGVAAIRLQYPDGKYNSEAMAVGADGTIYVITKSTVTKVYMAPYPQSTTDINIMKPVPAGTLAPNVDMSGADIRMDGRAIIVRGYRDAWTWPIKPGESMAATLARTPCKTPTYRPETQGEAIAFLANDGSYTTTGEMSRAFVRQFTL